MRTILFFLITIILLIPILLISSILIFIKNFFDLDFFIYNNYTLVNIAITKLYIYLLKKCIGLNYYYCGDILNTKNLWISNHRSKLDGIFLTIFLIMNNNNISCIIKKEIKSVPIINIILRYIETICIKRNKDGNNTLIKKISKIKNKNVSILLFPEGRTMSYENYDDSVSYSLKNKLPFLNNLLIPKINGYQNIIKYGDYNLIGDITIRYDILKSDRKKKHSFKNLLNEFPKNIYIDINYFEKNTDINYIFIKKDKILSQEIDIKNYKIFENEFNYKMFIIIFLIILFYYFFYNYYYFKIFYLTILLLSSFICL